MVSFSICILPAETAVMQPNKLAYDVITKTPAAQGESILTVAGCNAFEFLDVMPATTVMGIFG